MPATSPEAIARKNQRRREKRQDKRQRFKLEISKTSAGYRRQLPKLPSDMRKSELRAMLADAVQNTV